MAHQTRVTSTPSAAPSAANRAANGPLIAPLRISRPKRVPSCPCDGDTARPGAGQARRALFTRADGSARRLDQRPLIGELEPRDERRIVAVTKMPTPHSASSSSLSWRGRKREKRKSHAVEGGKSPPERRPAPGPGAPGPH